MYPLKRDSPSLLVTPPINLVLINPKKNTGMNEENRRLIARVAPVCLAYNFHLLLLDFGIKETPLDFAKNMATSTSIGKGGEIFALDMGQPIKILDIANELIRLSGLEPDIDIPISFIGARPGEKQFEQLVHDLESVNETLHDKILEKCPNTLLQV